MTFTSYDVASTSCAAPCPEVELGLAINDVVPDDQYLYPYARYSDEYFATHAISIITEGVDFSDSAEEAGPHCLLTVYRCTGSPLVKP